MSDTEKSNNNAEKPNSGKPEKAAPFALPDPQGNSYRLEDFRGKWLLMVFHRHLQ